MVNVIQNVTTWRAIGNNMWAELEIMSLSDLLAELQGKICENDLRSGDLTLKVKFKVTQNVTMWKAIGNNMGVGLEIKPLSDFLHKLQIQICKNAWFSDLKWP